MNNNWQFALTLAAIIAGIFFNQRAADHVRADMTALFTTLSGRIDMLTGKVIELIDRVSALEAKITK
jgi:hypothetical protein